MAAPGGSIIEDPGARSLALSAWIDHACALGADRALTLAGPNGYVRVVADRGAPMHALFAQLPAARPGHQHGVRAGRSSQRNAHNLVVAHGRWKST